VFEEGLFEMMLIKVRSDKYIQQQLVVSEDIIATASMRKR
jgi:hypothetical protein